MNTPLEPYYTDYLAALRDGSGRMASQVVERALTANVTADELYMRVFQLAQWEVGRMWQRNEFTVAQEHLATAITERLMGELRPYFKPKHDRGRTLMLGCAAREMHTVGAKMLVDFFEADGWTVYYLGVATPSADFLDLARRYHVDMMGVSSAMYYHCLLYTSPSPRDGLLSRMPSSA